MFVVVIDTVIEPPESLMVTKPPGANPALTVGVDALPVDPLTVMVAEPPLVIEVAVGVKVLTNGLRFPPVQPLQV